MNSLISRINLSDSFFLSSIRTRWFIWTLFFFFYKAPACLGTHLGLVWLGTKDRLNVNDETRCSGRCTQSSPFNVLSLTHITHVELNKTVDPSWPFASFIYFLVVSRSITNPSFILHIRAEVVRLVKGNNDDDNNNNNKPTFDRVAIPDDSRRRRQIPAPFLHARQIGFSRHRAIVVVRWKSRFVDPSLLWWIGNRRMGPTYSLTFLSAAFSTKNVTG